MKKVYFDSVKFEKFCKWQYFYMIIATLISMLYIGQYAVFILLLGGIWIECMSIYEIEKAKLRYLQDKRGKR